MNSSFQGSLLRESPNKLPKLSHILISESNTEKGVDYSHCPKQFGLFSRVTDNSLFLNGGSL
jgi:hypothetical protein